jgi:hypothetical protein
LKVSIRLPIVYGPYSNLWHFFLPSLCAVVRAVARPWRERRLPRALVCRERKKLTNIKLENTKTNLNSQKMIILVHFCLGLASMNFYNQYSHGNSFNNFKNVLIRGANVHLAHSWILTCYGPGCGHMCHIYFPIIKNKNILDNVRFWFKMKRKF